MNTEMLIGETAAEYADRLISQARTDARNRWGRCSAYRVGRILGEAGVEQIGSPYFGARSYDNFCCGITDGMRQRRYNSETPNV